MKLLLIVGGLVAAGFAVDRILLWLEWRGFIDYRRTYPGRMSTGQIGPAFLAIQGLLEPEKRHVLEQKNAVRTERDAAGGLGGASDADSHHDGQEKKGEAEASPLGRNRKS